MINYGITRRMHSTSGGVNSLNQAGYLDKLLAESWLLLIAAAVLVAAAKVVVPTVVYTLF